MKRLFSAFLMCVMLFCISNVAFAIGDGNIEGGTGDGNDIWIYGDDGVRVSVIRTFDHAVVTVPIDITNITPPSNMYHFGKISKKQYSRGTALSATNGGYTYINPVQPLPTVVSTDGSDNITNIKNYFTDEQVIRSIATHVGMDFDVLVGGEYKLLLEPIAYYKFEGYTIASTATEAALYDEMVSGLLRRKMGDLTHKHLPLSMYLQVADLGYHAWGGSNSNIVSNMAIKSSLGLGIISFTDEPIPPDPPTPDPDAFDYEYRVNTEVITSVVVSGGQSDPNYPVFASFLVNGRTYRVNNIYYPESDSQLVWIRWTTPPTAQTMEINVSVTGNANVSQSVIYVNVVDLVEKTPPNPVADDRNDNYTTPTIPTNEQLTDASWGVWSTFWQEYWEWIPNWIWTDNGWVDYGTWQDLGWWEFEFESYYASLLSTMGIKVDDKNPTAIDEKTMKSGYGIKQTVSTNVTSNQPYSVTDVQNGITYFPEFGYEDYWRLLERTGGSYNNSFFEFKTNQYSTYNQRNHFTPIWIKDGQYIPYTIVFDSWTPVGMMSINLTDYVNINGNLWSDWHIAEQKPN